MLKGMARGSVMTRLAGDVDDFCADFGVLFFEQDRDCLRVGFGLVVGEEDGVFFSRSFFCSHRDALLRGCGNGAVDEGADEIEAELVVVDRVADFLMVGFESERTLELGFDELKKKEEMGDRVIEKGP